MYTYFYVIALLYVSNTQAFGRRVLREELSSDIAQMSCRAMHCLGDFKFEATTTCAKLVQCKACQKDYDLATFDHEKLRFSPEFKNIIIGQESLQKNSTGKITGFIRNVVGAKRYPVSLNLQWQVLSTETCLPYNLDQVDDYLVRALVDTDFRVSNLKQLYKTKFIIRVFIRSNKPSKCIERMFTSCSLELLVRYKYLDSLSKNTACGFNPTKNIKWTRIIDLSGSSTGYTAEYTIDVASPTGYFPIKETDFEFVLEFKGQQCDHRQIDVTAVIGCMTVNNDGYVRLTSQDYIMKDVDRYNEQLQKEEDRQFVEDISENAEEPVHTPVADFSKFFKQQDMQSRIQP